MIKIRRGVFETNSSSTHSISIASKEDYEKWEKEEVYFEQYENIFKTREEIIEEIKKDEDYKDFDFSDTDETNDLIREFEYVTSKQYFNSDYLESYEHHYTSKNGDEIVVFGKYGHD